MVITKIDAAGGGQTAKRCVASPADAYEHARNPLYKHKNV